MVLPSNAKLFIVYRIAEHAIQLRPKFQSFRPLNFYRRFCRRFYLRYARLRTTRNKTLGHSRDAHWLFN